MRQCPSSSSPGLRMCFEYLQCPACPSCRDEAVKDRRAGAGLGKRAMGAAASGGREMGAAEGRGFQGWIEVHIHVISVHVKCHASQMLKVNPSLSDSIFRLLIESDQMHSGDHELAANTLPF